MAQQRKAARAPRDVCKGRRAETPWWVRICVCCLLTALAVVTRSRSGHATPAAHDPDLDRHAMDALALTTSYLQSLSAFVVHADTTRDEIARGDIRPQRTAEVRVAVRGRDRMRAETAGDQGERLLVYDGAVLHIHLKTERYSASMPAPSTLGETLETALEQHGIELPLLDVIYLATGGELAPHVRAARHVGTSNVGGVRCEQLAFRGTHVDWQLWIAAGDKPLPQKLVITTKDSPTWQQYSALLRWVVSPELGDGEFTFSAPRGTSPIALGPASGRAGPSSENRPTDLVPTSDTASAATSRNGSDPTKAAGSDANARRWRGGWFTLLLAALPFVHVPAIEPPRRARSHDIPVSSVHAAEVRRTHMDDNASEGDARRPPVAAPTATGPAPRAAPPARCHTLVSRSLTYHHCGGVYYQPVYDGSSVQYVIVHAP